MKRHLPLIMTLLATVPLLSALQRDGGQKATSAPVKPHLAVAPEAVAWGPPPPGLSQGAPPQEFLSQPAFQLAVLEGDPSKRGAVYSIRIKCPDGFRVAPHWHPTDEHLTVLQGTFGLGDGDTWDASKGHEMQPGTYSLVPAKMHHFGWCKGETIVQAHGLGPFKIIWVNSSAGLPQKKTK